MQIEKKMAEANGGWEVVGNKKGKPQQKAPLTKSKKKALAESLPKISPILPVKESPTIYDAFIEEEEKSQKKLEMEKEGKGVSSGGNKKHSGPIGKKLGDKKREPPTLENTVPELEVEDLTKVLETVKKSFPANPDVWLKDLASLMNINLDRIPDSDPAYEGKPLDYPMRLLPQDVHDMLLKTISGLSAVTVESFLDYCIDSILSDSTKNVPAHGYRLFVQLLLFNRPETAIKSLEKYLALLQKNQAKPARSVSIMWVIGQSGHSSLANGLKVWLTLMLPVLNQRNLSNYVVEYLENLFRLHPDVKTGFGVMTRADFFRLFSDLYGDQSNLSTDLRKKLRLLYPKIRAVAWGDVNTNLHNFFSAYLSRCVTDCNEAKQTELLDSLVTCLTMDVQSFSIWRQTYNKHLSQSSILLNHLASHLDDFEINRKMLRETVRAFHLTNEEMVSDPQMLKKPEYHSAVSSCKELLTKLNKITFPWKFIFLLIGFVFMAAFFVDVSTSGSVQKSKTYHFLEDAGILYFLLHTWNRVCIYSSKIALWIGENVPVHVSWVWQIISPYCILVWEKVAAIAMVVAKSTQPQRQWILEKLDEHLPIVLDYLGRCASTALSLTYELSSQVWNVVVYYFGAATDWLLMNIFTGNLHPENILAKLSSISSVVTPYISGAIEWASGFIVNK